MLRRVPPCPSCGGQLRHVRGARFSCTSCREDYGLFRKRAPYTGLHCVRLQSPAQVKQAEEEQSPAQVKQAEEEP
ncbi:MAG: hypothetical protein F4X69_02785 [Gemmatimonadetes bacterium]|nr:hypothetical protein [Gemmatimonadota bacterium]